MKKRLASFAHAFRGLKDFATSGPNAQIQLAAALAIAITGYVLDFTPTEWIAIVLCIGLVLSAEAMNTALEELANELTLERRPRIKRAKDLAAAAVLIASLASTLVATLILAQRI